MSSKKIEELYKEKLQDLEMTPSPEVWNKIESSLVAKKKSKKKFVWWFTSVGSAAAILLFFFLNTTNQNNQATNIASNQKETQKENQPSSENEKLEKETASKDTITTKENKDVVGFSVVLADNVLKASSKQKIRESVQEKEELNLSSEVVAEADRGVGAKNKEFIAQNNDLNTRKGSSSVAMISEKEVEESNKMLDVFVDKGKKSLGETLLAEKEEKEKGNSENEGLQKTWSVAPVISQYAYNSFLDKSPVDSRLDNATKSGQSNTSYGVSVAYNLSKKLKIKTGVHSITMAQNTNNQSFNTSFSRISSYENVDPTVVEISTSNSENIAVLFTDVATARNVDIVTDVSSSELEQRFGYIEVPVELSYNVLSTNRLSFYVSGGMSTLFLTENSLARINSSYTEILQDPNNLNNVNFSVNLGTDLEYHFSKQWFVNLNPSIKVQTQTFTKDNNRPYLLGVSTGINYKF